MYVTREIQGTIELQDEATHCTAARHELIRLENRVVLRLSSRRFDLAFHLPSSERRDNCAGLAPRARGGKSSICILCGRCSNLSDSKSSFRRRKVFLSKNIREIYLFHVDSFHANDGRENGVCQCRRKRSMGEKRQRKS